MIDKTALKKIAPLVEKSIQSGYYPGAVILAGQNERIIYQGVFGNRRILPNVAPMQFDTMFDLASLTKIVATAPAIMQLVESGKINLDTPVAQVWPAFGKRGKAQITVKELLTHTSGLPATLPHPKGQKLTDAYPWQGKERALIQIENLPIKNAPGTTFLYSDVNFMVLAYLVEKISKEPFDQYVQAHIYKPLGMNNTLFLPPTALHERIAPTEVVNNQLRWGKVHDPSAFAVEGIAGNAGLFSDASDLALYAQMLLNHGLISNSNHQPQYILKPATVEQMVIPQTPNNIKVKRGLGFDLAVSSTDSPSNPPLYSYGHTGWTGTYLWIDPATQSWLIILTNRIHPKQPTKNKLIADRKSIANMILNGHKKTGK